MPPLQPFLIGLIMGMVCFIIISISGAFVSHKHLGPDLFLEASLLASPRLRQLGYLHLLLGGYALLVFTITGSALACLAVIFGYFLLWIVAVLVFKRVFIINKCLCLYDIVALICSLVGALCYINHEPSWRIAFLAALSLIILSVRHYIARYTTSRASQLRRNARHVEFTYKRLYKRYSRFIPKNKLHKDNLRNFMFAIMVMEDTNVPPVARFFERLLWNAQWKRPMSTGIMQVQSKNKAFSDSESIISAYQKLVPRRSQLGNVEGRKKVSTWYNPDPSYELTIEWIFQLISKIKFA